MKDKVKIYLYGYDVKLIDQSIEKIIETVKQTGAKVKGPIPLPTKTERYIVIRSPFKHKDSREQFEMKTHKRFIVIIDINPATLDSLRRLQLSDGVGLEIK